MKKSLCYALLLFTLLASCGGKGTLSRLWLFTYTDGPFTPADSVFSAVSFLQLRNDGTYTRDFGQFEYGTWEMDKEQLFLTNQNGKTNRLGYTIKGKDMRLTVAGRTATFESKPLPDAKENPFSQENNRWRIPASKKETDDEIRMRLRNHCLFWEMYFRWALSSELTNLDVRMTPTLIKIYGNGFALKHVTELPTEWKSYFYDEEDCRKANEQMAYVFKNKNIAWANSDNRFKMFIGAFQQLGSYFEK
ncbi:MAG TPA: hypothetical protein VD993_17690 [Chitinophagaceae bacterium]|nr:hypothetical protein [Chitinophagaceae bacterium]